MIGGPYHLGAERAWKHRYAQILFEAFCENGLEREAALADAYAHADAQFLVRGQKSPEAEARSSLVWILGEEVQPHAAKMDGAAHGENPNNGAHNVVSLKTDSAD